jgi:hypothetical protein
MPFHMALRIRFFFLSCWEREKRKRRKKRDYPPHLTSSQLTLTPSLSLSLVFSSFLLAKFITCLERSELDYFFHMRYWSLFYVNNILCGDETECFFFLFFFFLFPEKSFFFFCPLLQSRVI